MYCKLCNHYISGFKARVRHQLEDRCPGFMHFFIVAYVEDNRPNYRQKWKQGRRIR